jgi:hypothetical protein
LQSPGRPAALAGVPLIALWRVKTCALSLIIPQALADCAMRGHGEGA